MKKLKLMTYFLQIEINKASFVSVHEKINDFLENFVDLVDWKNFNLRYLKLKEMDLKEVVEHLLSKRIDPEEYSKKFERTILLNIFEDLKDRNTILRDFEADIHRNIESQFKNMINNLWSTQGLKYFIILILKNQVQIQIISQHLEVISDIFKNKYLQNVGHSVRKIFEKQASMIQRILPCFMMRPLSACQYVNPERLHSTM